MARRLSIQGDRGRHKRRKRNVTMIDRSETEKNVILLLLFISYDFLSFKSVHATHVYAHFGFPGKFRVNRRTTMLLSIPNFKSLI